MTDRKVIDLTNGWTLYADHHNHPILVKEGLKCFVSASNHFRKDWMKLAHQRGIELEQGGTAMTIEQRKDLAVLMEAVETWEDVPRAAR